MPSGLEAEYSGWAFTKLVQSPPPSNRSLPPENKGEGYYMGNSIIVRIADCFKEDLEIENCNPVSEIYELQSAKKKYVTICWFPYIWKEKSWSFLLELYGN